MFALNLAWIIVWIERVRTPMFGGRALSDYIAVLVRGAYQFVLPIGGPTILDQLTWSFVVATIGFFLLRLLSRFAITDVALRTVAGVAAIAAFPIANLVFGLTYSSCCVKASKMGLAFELIVVLICGILFYPGKRWIPGPLMIVVLVLHFTMWAWETSSYFNIPAFVSDMRSFEYYHPWRRTLGSLGFKMVFTFGFPAFGLLASVIWVRYVRRSQPAAA